MARGDHIKVRRFLYSHHGIDCGDGTVIHYTGSPLHRINAAIRRTPLEAFTKGKKQYIIPYNPQPSPDEVIRRATDRLNEEKYSLVFNNCEHFATYCMTGAGKSPQVLKAIAATVVLVGGVLTLIAATKTGDVRKDTSDA